MSVKGCKLVLRGVSNFSRTYKLGLTRSNLLGNNFSATCLTCKPESRNFSVSQNDMSEASGASSSSDEFYDIIIAGGGLVGTALAVALGTSGRLSDKRILLLESAPKFWTKPPETGNDENPNFSNRVVALSPGSKDLLNKLGVWPDVWRFQTVTSLQVWDALSDANIAFNYPNYSSPVSYIVENPVLAYAICLNLDKAKNVSIRFNSKVKSCTIPSSGDANNKASAFVQLDDGRTLKTDLLVGADGFNSKVRTSISSPAIAFNYDRTAVVATLKLSETVDNNVAWQRFLPMGGPIAMLPLGPHYSSLVWSTTPMFAKDLLDMSSEEFVDAINSAFWKEYGRSDLVKKSLECLQALNLGHTGPRVFPPPVTEVIEKSRACFPLGFGHSAYYANRRAVLIGDAAHRVHPLAGQGLNLGLGDVEVLEKVLSQAVGIGGDIGSFEILREYESQRQRHNIAIQSGIDFLHRLYSVDAAPIVALRSVGLSIVNSSDILKKYIMSHAAV